MERRTFIGVVGGAGLPAQLPAIQLKAFAAEHLPQTLTLQGHETKPPGTIYEVRSYETNPPDAELLTRHGIEVLEATGQTLLLAFPNLEARNQSWSALTADPAWKGGDVTEISLYAEVES